MNRNIFKKLKLWSINEKCIHRKKNSIGLSDKYNFIIQRKCLMGIFLFIGHAHVFILVIVLLQKITLSSFQCCYICCFSLHIYFRVKEFNRKISWKMKGTDKQKNCAYSLVSFPLSFHCEIYNLKFTNVGLLSRQMSIQVSFLIFCFCK